MNLIPVRYADIGCFHKPTKLSPIFEEFEASGAEAVEVEWKNNYASAKSCANALYVALKRNRRDGTLTIVTRHARVYIVKREVM